MNRSQTLGEEKVSTLLWRFSIPAIIGMVVNALYNVVDSIFVGNGVGEIGLTAVTIAFPIMLVMMGFGMLVGVGAATLVSIRMGEGKKPEAEKILGNAVSMLVLIAITVTCISLYFLDPMLIKLGATADVLPYARTFTRIIMLGSIFMYVSFGINNVIRAEGNPKIAMATMLISAILNTILNPIFIFGLKIGIAGSALATVISQAVSAVWVSFYFLGSNSVLKLTIENLKFEKRIVMSIVKIGLSPFLMQVAASLVTVILNFSLLKYGGETAVASIGVINRVAMLMLMPIFGISQGAQPIIGYNFGAKNHHRVLEALKKAIIAATAVSCCGFLITQFFAIPIIRLFNNDPNLIAVGSNGIRIFLAMLPIIGFQIIGANYFQAVGKAGYAIFLSMSRQVIVMIPLVFILPNFFQLNGVWFAGPVSDLVASIFTGIFLVRELKRVSKQAQAGLD